MSRPRIAHPWRWASAVLVVVLVVGGVVFQDEIIHEVAVRSAGGPAVSTHAGAESAAPTSRTRRKRAPGRNRKRHQTPSPGDPTSVAMPPPQGGRNDGARVVIGLGDSVPAGSNCDGCATYIDQVGRMLAESGRGSVVYNYAVPGATSNDVLGQLDGRKLKSRLGQADLVILTVGANDLDTTPLGDANCAGPRLMGCYTEDLGSLGKTLRTIEERVGKALKPGGKLLVTGYWNVFSDGAVGRAEGPAWVNGSDALTLRANDLIKEVTESQGAQYVDVRTPFRGSDGSSDCTVLLADDGEHLSAAGHALMASTVTEAVRARNG